MKKSVFNTIANYIANHDIPELASIRDEVLAEYNKNKAETDAKMSVYERAHDVVMKALDNSPYTIAEIYELCADVLPDGFSKANLQYAVLHYWQDEFEKIANAKGANTYIKK